ncbi:MAG: hypothetical protein KAI97_02610, partial [Gemmatimonadetes bacterium]|nr:hypothetical protein [Gemmatimonadota bacterium]
IVPTRFRLHTAAPLLALPLILGACAARSQLSPSQSAHRVAGDPHSAVVSTGGVEILTNTDAWSGDPRQFNRVLPILVTITNDGDVPLRVRHSDFSLVTSTGERVTATSPFDLDIVEVEAYDTPIYPYAALSHGGHSSYGVSSFSRFGHYGRFGHFRGFGGSGYPFGGLYYSPFRRIELPTTDMVAKSLPERILEPGERTSGFLFFKEFSHDFEHVEFEVELVNAETRDRLATLGIPFTADGAREPASLRGRMVEIEGSEPTGAAARQIGNDGVGVDTPAAREFDY